MPLLTRTLTTGGTVYADPFVGVPGPAAHVKIDLSGLTTSEVDSLGNLKPGVPLTSAGVLVGSSGIAHIVINEPTPLNLGTIPPTNTTLGSETGDHLVAGPISGYLNLDIIEDNLGRALTSDEKAGLDTIAGSRFRLSTT
jgi:hypothetical protein